MKLLSLYSTLIVFSPTGTITEGILLESKDSTVLLDLDETLIHVVPISDTLIKDMEDGAIQLTDRSISKTREFDADAFEKASSKYGDQIELIKFKAPRPPSIAVFRPGLCEFINKLNSMKENGLIKDVIVYSANTPSDVESMMKSIEDKCGVDMKSLSLDRQIDPTSVMVDDSPDSAVMKMLATQIINKLPKYREIPSKAQETMLSRWVKVKPFRGDLKDNELLQVLPKIRAKM